VLHKETFTTSDYSDGTAYADRLAEAVRAVISQTESQQPGVQFEWLGIGIGAPNGNHRSGCIEQPPNLNFKGNTPLVELMKARLNLPAIDLTNDANAAAIGEKTFGAAKDYSDFIMITLGIGLGSGVLVNNQLVYDHDGFAGEVGHISVIPDRRYCGFGRRGSLENYCSATGIRRTFFAMLAQLGGPTALDHLHIGKLNSKDVADAAEKGGSSR
jgi:glucokinase